MKLCTKCNQQKDFSAFSKKSSTKDGYQYNCKECTSAYLKKYQAVNQDVLKEKKSEYYKANQEQFAEKKAAYYAANKDKIYAYGKEYYAKNKDLMLEKNAQYREQNKEHLSAKDAEAYRRNEGKYRADTMNAATSKINRKPAWLTEFDHTYIQCLHQLAAMRSRESSEQWEVDHIIPLRGKLVSGLHVPSNLQVITAKANQQKNNSYTVN
jgi:5-methylcytosine-specific restriction endonuclease McrA